MLAAGSKEHHSLVVMLRRRRNEASGRGLDGRRLSLVVWLIEHCLPADAGVTSALSSSFMGYDLPASRTARHVIHSSTIISHRINRSHIRSNHVVLRKGYSSSDTAAATAAAAADAAGLEHSAHKTPV